MNRQVVLAQFERLIPLAARWAETLEARILSEGVLLSEEETADAHALGVRAPERVRLLCLASVPTPDDLALRTAAAAVEFLTPATRGLALRYGIFIRADCWRERGLIAHELAHTEQYERGNTWASVSPSVIPRRRWSRRRTRLPAGSRAIALPNELQKIGSTFDCRAGLAC